MRLIFEGTPVIHTISDNSRGFFWHFVTKFWWNVERKMFRIAWRCITLVIGFRVQLDYNISFLIQFSRNLHYFSVIFLRSSRALSFQVVQCRGMFAIRTHNQSVECFEVDAVKLPVIALKDNLYTINLQIILALYSLYESSGKLLSSADAVQYLILSKWQHQMCSIWNCDYWQKRMNN